MRSRNCLRWLSSMRVAIKLLLSWLICGGLGLTHGWASYTQPLAMSTVRAPMAADPLVIQTVEHKAKRFQWKPAIIQSLTFLAIEHGVRLHEQKTRAGLKGPFFPDWGTSIRNVSGWGDGDNWLTNYVAHPMEGAVAGYIQIQNDPRGQGQVFGRSKQYWYSRLKAFAWSVGYSTQFEIGLISEASIGNAGLIKGTAGFVDLIGTPLAGLGLIVAEDALDRFVLRKIEARTTSRWKLSVCRIILNPDRSFAGVLRGKFPWQQKPQAPRMALAANWKLSPDHLAPQPKKIEGWNHLSWPNPVPAGMPQRETNLQTPALFSGQSFARP